MDKERRIGLAWVRLQALSCCHSRRLYQSRTNRWRGCIVPAEIAENVDILGRGDEEELKARVLWYLDQEPAVFQECSKQEWWTK